MTLEPLSRIVMVTGELMVAFTAIRVHHRVLQEHRIDKRVYVEMRREQVVGIIGVMFIVIGFALEASTWM